MAGLTKKQIDQLRGLKGIGNRTAGIAGVVTVTEHYI